MVKVKMVLNNMLHLEVTPLDQDFLAQVKKEVEENGGEFHPTIYLQDELNVKTLLADLTPQEQINISIIGEIEKDMDDWEVRHFYGYCSS